MILTIIINYITNIHPIQSYTANSVIFWIELRVLKNAEKSETICAGELSFKAACKGISNQNRPTSRHVYHMYVYIYIIMSIYIYNHVHIHATHTCTCRHPFNFDQYVPFHYCPDGEISMLGWLNSGQIRPLPGTGKAAPSLS